MNINPTIAVPVAVMALKHVGIDPTSGRPTFVQVPVRESDAPGIFDEGEVIEAIEVSLALQAIQLFLERLPRPAPKLSGRWFAMMDGPPIPLELAEVIYQGYMQQQRYRTLPFLPLEEMEGKLAWTQTAMIWVNTAARDAMLQKLAAIEGIL